MAQLWIIYKTNGKDLYAIQNIHTKTFLMATGFVVDLDHGKETNGTPVHLRPERGNNHDVGREMQKWLLQIQK
ncbi:MAG: hypothetical protein LQ350_000845 [Teloschistes chrysophthalmus]|nr:MAG: hypothetical protein LQ350_000845 [Niorma chrysophthalma]